MDKTPQEKQKRQMKLPNKAFKAENISIVDFKLLKGQVESPDDFSIELVEGHNVENTLELGFNLLDKLVKADFTTNISTKSKLKSTPKAKGNFHFVFIYKVENLEELAILNEDNMIDLDLSLGNALSSITYSTSRGILITRLQGTALQNFFLPVINPNNLLYKKVKK